MGLSEQQLACVKADELAYQFLEYLKYYHPLPFPENEWNDPKNKVTFVIRLALGQYYQKGACAAGIKFSDFVQCLSSDCCNGWFQAAREAGYLPKYRRTLAKKYKIPRGYTAPQVAKWLYYE